MGKNLDVATLDRELHDAHLDLTTVRTTEAGVVVAGRIERPIRDRFPPALGRFPIVVMFHRAARAVVEDDAAIDMLLVGEITYDRESRTVRIEGSIPGRLFIQTTNPCADLEIGEHPSEVRQWWRWKRAEDEP
jgi:hypothetical protein